MTPYSFPLLRYSNLVERVDTVPDGSNCRRWVRRDDNQQHYHGRVSLDEDPTYLELRWKADARAEEQAVGTYRLHLVALLKEGFVRRESDRPDETMVRLRFHRGERGVVFIQVRNNDRGLAIGTVDQTLR